MAGDVPQTAGAAHSVVAERKYHADLLAVPAAGGPLVGSARDATLQMVWDEHAGDIRQLVHVIGAAAAALTAGGLDLQLREQARRSAHMLAGSTGMFGLAQASAAARELEVELTDATRARAPTLLTLIAIISRELEDGAIVPPRAAAQTEQLALLLVTNDRTLGDPILAASAWRELSCQVAVNAQEARLLCATRLPAIALLDLTVERGELTNVYELLAELSAAAPPIPVLVLTDGGTFADRVEVARRGSRAFLSRSLAPEEVWSAVERSLVRDRLAATRVLLVDDDAVALAAMSVLLRRRGLEVFTLDDSLRFWETLEQVAPELLILDVDMPGVDGPELCRTVRNDPRWSRLAVIFATAGTDQDTIERVFSAGADDYIAKPIIGPELLARVSNRLERVRLHRAEVDTDGLTGLCTRVASEQGLEQLIALGDRFSEPVSVVMLDLDRFKLVNDTHGHSAGDEVLRAVGVHLRGEFRGNDVVGRWGGEEFVIGMYGMARASAVRRLAELQRRFGREKFSGIAGEFQVSFSAGVAEYTVDGDDVDAVCAAADKALYRAKSGGRARVLDTMGGPE